MSVRAKDHPRAPAAGPIHQLTLRSRRGAEGQSLPGGALLKIARLKALVVAGPARVFESEEDCAVAVQDRSYREGRDLTVTFSRAGA